MLRLVFILFFCCFSVATFANTNPRPLPPEEAFAFKTQLESNKQVLLQWEMAPGYYLYRDSVHIESAASSQTKTGKIHLPAGKPKHDEIRGDYQAYSGMLEIPVPLLVPTEGILNLNVSYQGCSASGFCYAPIKKEVRIDVTHASGNVVVTSLMPSKKSDQYYTESLFEHANYFMVILTFLGLGLLLAFTPCVLPMVPILSSILLGQKEKVTARGAFFLSLTYVLGMALTYAAAGMIVAMLGNSVQVFFQNTWVIVLFSGLFVILALSLFGLYDLKLPNTWQNKLTHLSNNQAGGTYLGVFLMGILSTLIVSPCVSAPLVGVLTYIAQTGDIVLGGTALLAMGLGMGMPLLLVGMSAGTLLPKAGIWMETVKKIFGLLLLAVAIWMLSRVIPGSLTLILWGLFIIGCSIFLAFMTGAKKLWLKLLRGDAGVILVYGIILVIGGLFGNVNPLRPWEEMNMASPKKQDMFITVKTLDQLNQVLQDAKKSNQAVLVDFYADWCASCIMMERNVFPDVRVQEAISRFVLLRVNVTDNNAADQAILKNFHVVAPPTILFFNEMGHELKTQRMVGESDAEELIKHIQQLN